MRDSFFSKQAGVTLIELSVVLAILVALASVIAPRFQNTGKYSQCVATDTTMIAIRDAILGGVSAGYYSDVGQYPHFDNGDLSQPAASLSDLFVMPAGFHTYNPATRRGWRGPYLLGGVSCQAIANAVNANTTTIDPLNICNLSSTPVNPYTVVLDSFPVLSATGGATLLSGSPIVMMQDSGGNYFLVSAGPNSVLQTGSHNVQTRSTLIDDRVLYLNFSDPIGNPVCIQ